MIRRTPEAIISAALMDPKRRDLYVEGVSDKLILEYLLRERMGSNVRILPIDIAVETNVTLDGAKGRLIAFATQAEVSGVTNLRFLADSDMDDILGVQPPSNTFMTDFPDMEGYVISERNLDKLLRVSLSLSQPGAQDLHRALMRMASSIALLRFISKRDSLRLRITKTNKSRCILINTQLPELDLPRLIRTVCQNTPRLPCEESVVCAAVEASREDFESIYSKKIRGKDYMELMGLFFRKLQVGVRDFDAVLLGTLHEAETMSQPTLKQITLYLSGKA